MREVKMSEEDRRVQKTRKLLKDALISLILDRGYESVTIQDIIDTANVGRSTFYMHFENKDALLHSCFEEFHEMFDKYDLNSSDDLRKSDFIVSLFRLVERNQRLCKALMGKDDMTMFFNPVHKFIYDYFEESVSRLFANAKHSSLKLELIANYVTSALLGTLRWWVYKDMPYTVEEMDRFFKDSVLRDMQKML
jgi:AcrR family transcriptional regulator